MLRDEAKKLYFKYLSPEAPLKIKYQVTILVLILIFFPFIYCTEDRIFLFYFFQVIFNIKSHLIEIESTLKAADAHSKYTYSKTLHILVKLSKTQCSSVKLFCCRTERI